MLRAHGLLGWYRQQPSDSALLDSSQLQLPCRWTYIVGAIVIKQRHPPDILYYGPLYVVEVSEDGDDENDAPLLRIGSDAEVTVDAWLRELLRTCKLCLGPELHKPWTRRGASMLTESAAVVARGAATTGESVAQISCMAGATVEGTLVGVGAMVGEKAAKLLHLPDAKAAVDTGGTIGQLFGVSLSLAVQSPGAALGVLGRWAGGTRRPSFCYACEGQTRIPLAVSNGLKLLGQLLPCDGCGGVPVSDEGCCLCRMRLCPDCFNAHCKPAGVHVVSEVPAASKDAIEERRLDKEFKRLQTKAAEEYHKRVRDAKNELLATAQPKTVGAVLPEHWKTLQARPVKGWAVSPVDNQQLLRGLQACLETCGTDLGSGRDVREAGQYSRLRLACAWRVEHHLLWPRYCQALAEVKAHQSQVTMPPITLQNEAGNLSSELCDWAVALGCSLNEALNEKLLAHGTKPENVAAVLQNGLNERFCSGMFGNGCYLAENCGKCDQYCTTDREYGAHHELHPLLYADCDRPHPKDVHYIFLFRAVLGVVACTKDGNNLISGASVWANLEKRELAAIPGVSPALPYHSMLVETGVRVARYREIITCHSERLYPEYLIAYHRR